MSPHDSDHMRRIREEEAGARHQDEVEAALADREGPEQEEAPDAASGPLAAEGEAGDRSLLSEDLTKVLQERKNFEPNPEVQEALRGLREIPVREALDET